MSAHERDSKKRVICCLGQQIELPDTLNGVRLKVVRIVVGFKCANVYPYVSNFWYWPSLAMALFSNCVYMEDAFANDYLLYRSYLVQVPPAIRAAHRRIRALVIALQNALQ